MNVEVSGTIGCVFFSSGLKASHESLHPLFNWVYVWCFLFIQTNRKHKSLPFITLETLNKLTNYTNTFIRNPPLYFRHNSSDWQDIWYKYKWTSFVLSSLPGDLVTSFWEGRENILIPHPMSHCGPTQLKFNPAALSCESPGLESRRESRAMVPY